jgi:hypothetical protein
MHPGITPADTPLPIVIEHAEPGRVSCRRPKVLVGLKVDVEAELLGIKRLGPIDV